MPKSTVTITSDGYKVIGENTHLVYFAPIAVPKEVAEELSSPDPLGTRVELEVRLLKEHCLIPIQGREPFPYITDVVKMTEDELHEHNMSNKPPHLRADSPTKADGYTRVQI